MGGAVLDVLIRGGEVIDGSGRERRRADVGIRDGRIAGVGRSDEPARSEIDARGRIVAPGFVDIHTHFDAQAFWDGGLTPAPLHGVTTAIGGNCGFSIAPLDEASADYLMRMLAKVEGMPLESLAAGVPWDWRSFGDYLARLDGRLAVNAGFLVGHSALRRVAMGEDATRRAASERELRRMGELLGDSLRAGGLGFSSSHAPTHNDGDGRPVPSRAAGREELIALCAEVRRHPGTTLEFIPTVGPFSDPHVELMIEMSLAAGRPLNWNVLAVQAQAPGVWRDQLAASDRAAARGARVVALTLPLPLRLRINLRTGFVFDALPGWAPVLALPLDERRRALADPAVRRRLDEGANSEAAGVLRGLARWERLRVADTQPEHAACRGRSVGDLAAALGKSPLDAMLDLALADDLRTSFMPPVPGDDDESWRMRGEVWGDPRTVIGASDAGAHLDMIDTFTCSTTLLGTGVRERRLIALEEAIRQLTDVPARLYGLRGRGRIEAGWCADVVVLDAERVGPGPVVTRYDLPGGAGRLYAEADGIDHVLVNGVEIVQGGALTGALPGRVLRSGRDTETVGIPADAQRG